MLLEQIRKKLISFLLARILNTRRLIYFCLKYYILVFLHIFIIKIIKYMSFLNILLLFRYFRILMEDIFLLL